MIYTGQFEKVSFDRFYEDIIRYLFNNDPKTNTAHNRSVARELYDRIKLPKRATEFSAGYDFYSPFSFSLKPGDSIVIPTGIRVMIDDSWFLMLAPRSGLGFKHRLQLDNTVGIIDADYYNAKNEGHIMAKLTCDSMKADDQCSISCGTAFMQGIFLPYGITTDDEAGEIRTGGLGSTGVNI